MLRAWVLLACSVSVCVRTRQVCDVLYPCPVPVMHVFMFVCDAGRAGYVCACHACDIYRMDGGRGLVRFGVTLCLFDENV